ncbi:MAG TPA: N-acetylglucosamine-6-phosphate deacetylase [Flavitalea sp.]|nr:N-acetylglucosamine-6-phosphate deacetylase [Flavitalea sp.]
MRKAYINGIIYTGRGIERNKTILVNDGSIEKLHEGEISAEYQIVDLEGKNIAPAFIDLQIYGGDGKMFSSELSVESLESTYNYCKRGGAAHFMITMATNTIEKFLRGIEVVKAYWKKGGPGLLGLHLEGPYLNPVKKGAHIASCIKKPVAAEVSLLLEKGKDVIKMITIAPEMCDENILQQLIQSGIIVSAGHTNATYGEAKSAFDKGIPAATHLFNAMSPFLHREPGVVGAIYDHERVMTSVVTDGVHVDFAAVRISKQLLKERLFFITDAVAEVLTGEYQHVFKGDRYTLPDGTLSGSSLTMMKSVINAVEKVGISLEEALRMAATYPAKLLGEKYRLGKIEAGYKAFFVVFDDQLNIVAKE